MNFVSALKEFESLKSDLGRYRYQMKVDDSVIVSFCQKLGSLLSHFYTSNLIINSFGGDLIPIKFNANRLNGNERIQMLDKLLESILNDIKLKESEEILTPKESNQIESLKSNYNDLMQERNEVVVKHNELVTELDDLYPKIQSKHPTKCVFLVIY
ncbi:MAG: hypothetical protein DI539_24770 [Flavobacterium psychrophilum]|nr:MAG: hypothetical protein DI539_24770 [Flavobacterium psychrophilum]